MRMLEKVLSLKLESHLFLLSHTVTYVVFTRWSSHYRGDIFSNTAIFMLLT